MDEITGYNTKLFASEVGAIYISVGLVPEPSTEVLLAGGGSLLGMAMRRRRGIHNA